MPPKFGEVEAASAFAATKSLVINYRNIHTTSILDEHEHQNRPSMDQFYVINEHEINPQMMKLAKQEIFNIFMIV